MILRFAGARDSMARVASEVDDDVIAKDEWWRVVLVERCRAHNLMEMSE